MVFRDHPLMRYRGVPSWPPDWIWTDGLEDKRPKGEIGSFPAGSTVQYSTEQQMFSFYRP